MNKKYVQKRNSILGSDGDDSQMFQNGFTSTVCVKFSQDDLRLATIPGQVQLTILKQKNKKIKKYKNNILSMLFSQINNLNLK